MTRGMLSVFGVLREADELELDASVVAVRARLSKSRNSAAIRDLRSAGLVVSRRVGWRTFVRLNQKAAK